MNWFDKILANVKWILILIVVLLIIQFLTPLTTSIANLLDRLAPPPTAEVLSTRAIINSLKGIGKLVTVTSDPHFREVEVSVKRGIWIFENAGSYSASHEVEGIIEAGIDFTEIRGDSLICGDTCILNLPAPSITNCTITRLRQNDQSRVIGGRDWELLEELGRHEAIHLFIEDVKEIGIIEKVKEETEVLLGEFVSNLLDKPVDVAFEDSGEETKLDDTCDPDPPFGWSKEDGEWSRDE